MNDAINLEAPSPSGGAGEGLRTIVLLIIFSRLRYSLTLTISQRKRRKDQNMDWRVMLTTFGIIFLAEMGDKTQIAAMTMAAEKKRPWEVFIAASLALAAVSAIGVVVGSTLSHLLPLEWIKRAAGAAFIVIGVLVLIGKF